MASTMQCSGFHSLYVGDGVGDEVGDGVGNVVGNGVVGASNDAVASPSVPNE